MIAAGQADQHVTLLQFQRVLPSSAWLRASILWADDLAAIWPVDEEPTPFDRGQQQSLEQIWDLRVAGLFEPKFIPDLPGREALRRLLDDWQRPDVSEPLDEVWQDDGKAVGPSSATGRRLQDYDPETFVYHEKLPEWIIDELIERKLIKPRPAESGYVADSAESLTRLLSAYATVLHEVSGGRLVPTIEQPAQARRIAAPSSDNETRQALVVMLHSAVTPDLETDFQRFIEFRLNEENECARRDYLEQLVGFWDLCARGGPDHALKEAVGRVTKDLRKARESYFKRVDNQTLTAAGLASCGAVIPLLAAHPPAAIVGALVTVGASVVTVTVRMGAPKYVRNATKAELLAPTGSI
jgi:hypothetical protein